jgi:ATP-binding protein involved in chromosome partitioning
VPVVAIASGKGGVGKTTVAVNLALALAAAGVRTGLVDADLYGPDVPRMLGLRRRQDSAQLTVFGASGTAGARLQAVGRHGIQVASAAFLMGEGQGLGIDAGLAQLLVQRLIAGTEWDRPDCLIVDLPPGTADIQQLVFALRGRSVYVLVVVTPQVIAHQDVRRLLADVRRRAAMTSGGAEILGPLRRDHADVPGRAARRERLRRDRADRERAVQPAGRQRCRPGQAGTADQGRTRAGRCLRAAGRPGTRAAVAARAPRHRRRGVTGSPAGAPAGSGAAG